MDILHDLQSKHGAVNCACRSGQGVEQKGGRALTNKKRKGGQKLNEFEIRDEVEQAYREGIRIGFKQGWEACEKHERKGETVEIKGKLPSLNEYIGACRSNPRYGAKMKQDTETLIILQISRLRLITSPVILHFEWHEKTRRRDKDNVAAGKKFVLDAMQKAGKLVNDNNKYIAGFTDRFVYGVDYGVKIKVENVDDVSKQWTKLDNLKIKGFEVTNGESKI